MIGGLELNYEIVVIVMALVEYVKRWGWNGKVSDGLALLFGVIFSFVYAVIDGVALGTAQVVLMYLMAGILYGLTAAGVYDFGKNMIERVKG
jgi:hypothetical protein